MDSEGRPVLGFYAGSSCYHLANGPVYTGFYGNDAAAPPWALAVLFAVLPGLKMRVVARDRGRVAGGCGRCGYSLVGNVSGVCPECGTAVAGKGNG